MLMWFYINGLQEFANTTSPPCGKAAISKLLAYGIGTSAPVTRITDCTIVSISNGLRERRLITSASIPFPASSLAASRACSTALECATKVKGNLYPKLGQT
ncbi:hypothetical protein V1477_013347 [Vespula maculifrons]|uniref:Uncharacterized protein n=1 Tax=Vespula maculifrons TaxID=7453 RepID=A0ABD2BQM9_VESMC